jgi:hypothetical protein
MRERSDEEGRGVRGEHRVGVERDDVAHLPHQLELADYDGEGSSVAVAQELVELGQLAALALPPHPHALLRIPEPRPVEEVERILRAAGVAGVERANALDRRLDDGVVLRPRLGGGVGEVAEDGEVEVRFAVGEELHLERRERFVHRFDVGEERRDHDRRSELGGNAPRVAQVELRQRPRREEGGDELVHDADGDVARRNQREEEDEGPRPSRLRPGKPEERRDRRHGEGEDAPDEDHVRVTQHPAVDRLAHGWPEACRSLELVAPRIHQVVADVRAPRLVRALAGPREIDRSARDVGFGEPRPLGDPLDGVAVPVACREGHPRMEARRVRAQHRFDQALLLDDRAPVHPRDRAQARDAVRHHDLREREVLRRARGGVLGAQRILGDPLLEPDQGREGPGDQP